MTTFLTTCLLLAAATTATALQPVVTDTVQTGSAFAPTGVGQSAYQGGMTLDQAVEQVRRQYNGRIVSAETKVSGGRETHIIKVLTSDGKVKTVRVPGRKL